MCGICGQFDFGSGAPVDPGSIRAMMDTIIHRGPDDQGMYLSGSLGLGFRRLSIIDLAAGHQPMSDPTEKTWVVFNGEIYNFQELRRELEDHGHQFRTHCDTEVIVHGYREWGDEVLNRLKGMFGLAVWDEERRRLLLARDQMGIKPVYYALQHGRLWFGSELRPILKVLPARPAVDLTGFNLFLRYRYTPSPYTIHEGIRKLAPGEKMVIENGAARLERYYQYAPDLFSPPPSDEEACETLLELYKAAVKRHLISDVPLGLLLSGGIDSGLLLGLMRLHGREWPTFTVGYGTSFRDDELDDAAETARIYEALHHPVRLDQTRFEESLSRIVDALEEPVASSSIVPMYFVCERARQEVKVALVGQGPDELFGGYKRHLGVQYGAAWRSLPGWARDVLGAGLRRLPRNESLKRALYSLDVGDRLRRYQQVFSLLPGPEVDALFQPGVLPSGAGDRVLDCWADLADPIDKLDELGGLQFVEIRSSLPDELLMYGDKLSMIHALEVRVPYLDRDLVEYSQRLDASFKVRWGERKWLHRRVCRQFLPREILGRRKRGFAVNVVDQWFKESLGRQLDQYLRDPRSAMYQFLRPDVVSRLLEEHAVGRHDHHKILFSLVVFEQWMRSRG